MVVQITPTLSAARHKAVEGQETPKTEFVFVVELRSVVCQLAVVGLLLATTFPS